MKFKQKRAAGSTKSLAQTYDASPYAWTMGLGNEPKNLSRPVL